MTRPSRGAVTAGRMLGAAAFFLILTGCSNNTSTSAGGGTPVPGGAENIAVVDNTPIPASEFYDDMQCYVPTQQAAGLPVGQAVLNRMIRSTILEKIAKTEGAYPTDAEISQAVSDIQAVNDATYVKAYTDQLAESGMTADFVRRWEIIPSLCQLNLVTRNLNISDRDVQSYYEMHVKDVYTRPAAAHVKRIVARSEAEVQQYYKQLMAGIPFDQVYKQSTDRTLKNGEIPNWISFTGTNDSTMQPVLNAVKNTSAGKFTAPIKLGKDTWWIAYVVEARPAQVLPFESAKTMARTSLENEKLTADPTPVNDFENDLRNKIMHAQIVVTNPEYDTLVTAMHNPAPIPAFPRSGPAPLPGTVPPGGPGHPVPSSANSPVVVSPGAPPPAKP